MSTSTKTPPAPRWDIDSIFPGGSGSTEFKVYREKVAASVTDTQTKFAALPKTLDDSSQSSWVEFILQWQSVLEDIELVASFSSMLSSQNVDDSGATALEAEGDELSSEWEKIKSGFEILALGQDNAAWEKLVTGDELLGVRFYLDEMREMAKSKMSVEKESLALELSVNGLHAWNRLYDKMAGDLRVDFPEGDTTTSISLGQLATKISDPVRSVRAMAFKKMTEAWESRADLAAMVLNSLAGYRLALYKARGWESTLYEPLKQARMSQAALDAMWSVITSEKSKLVPYVEAKKKLIGADKFCWYDEYAPVGAVDRTYTYDEAADFIVRHVGEFSPDLAKFCRMAIDKRWIEAEDRAGKRGGGYCTGTGKLRQTRIFMTYANSYENLLTLAHELGHSYHNEVLKDRPFFATEYPMTLAETASIFNELLVTDAALSEATEHDEKLMLVDQKLQGAYTLFCDIHSRYLFDTSFYAERKEGMVSRKRLDELMIAAQKEAYGNGTLLDPDGHHPLFWASKLHFFLSDVPFYNYPYTVGFLFATGVYDRAKKEGPAFAKKYVALLEDSGSMTTDQAAAKHMGVDLTKEDFWRSAVQRALADVPVFVKLANGA
jgi:pepF/M3 family oligoendopeptidase